MKIAILSSGFLPVVDGVTVALWHRLRRLSELKHEVLVFCPDYQPLQSIYPNWSDYTGNVFPGVQVVNLPSTAFMGVEFERNVTDKAYAQVLTALDQFRPDVIHADEPDRLFLGFGKIPAIAYAKAHRIPCTSFYHTNFLEYLDDYVSLPGPIQQLVKDLCRRFITCRVFNAYEITLVSGRTTYEKLIRLGIRNAVYEELLGVDLKSYSPELQQEDFFEQVYGLQEVGDRLKLVFLGRLTPDKGWRFTLKAIPQLLQQINASKLSLIIVGDGEMRDEIAATLRGIVDVHFLGRVLPEAVPAILANSDIHVTTSEKETRGLTILEAFAAGIPVVAPQAGGIIDSVQNGINGLLYEPGNVNDFVIQLKQLIDDPLLRQNMGQQGQSWVQNYSWEQASDRLLRIWENRIY